MKNNIRKIALSFTIIIGLTIGLFASSISVASAAHLGVFGALNNKGSNAAAVVVGAKTSVQISVPKDNAESSLANGLNMISNEVLELNIKVKNFPITGDKSKPSSGINNRDEVINKMRTLLKNRKKILEETLEKDPKIVLLNVFSPEIINTFPDELKDEIEKKVTIQGNLETIHIDDFKKKTSQYKYFLKKDKKRYPFFLVGNDLLIPSGSKLKVDGFQIGEKIVAAKANNTIQKIETVIVSEAVGEQKTLAILVNYKDSPASPFSKEEARKLIFDGGFQKFYKESSYGKTFFSGDVAGWYTLNRNHNEVWPSSFDSNGDPDGIYALLKKDNINLRNYQRVVFLVNHPNMGGGLSGIGKWAVNLEDGPHKLSFSWIGTLQDFSKDSFYGKRPFPWTNLDFLLSHEVGHALGVLHANSLDCGSEVFVDGNCTRREYGNYYDTMGSGNYSLHHNALFKDILGWTKDSILTIDKSGIYTIKPLELSSGVSSAKIVSPFLNYSPYYLEYRQGLGFDANLNNQPIAKNQDGLFVNASKKESYSSIGIALASWLLDMTPSNTFNDWNDWSDVVLRGENIFKDIGSGITVGPIISATKDEIKFKVEIAQPICERRTPTITIDYPGYFVNPGSQINLFVMIENRDSDTCTPDNFTTSIQVPPGWGSFQNNSALLSPGENNYSYFSVKVPVDAKADNYKVDVSVQSLVGQKKFNQSINFVLPLSITSPNGGEKIKTGEIYRITWKANYAGQLVSLNLVNSINGDNMNIAESIPMEKGYYDWTLPSANKLPGGKDGDNFKIKISTPNQYYSFVDESDALFSIVDPFKSSITIISPNGGEMIKVGGVYTIKWSSVGFPPHALVQIQLHSVNNPKKIVRVLADKILMSKGSYLWKWDINMIDLSYNKYLISIMDLAPNGVSAVDFSDAPFIIVAKGK